MSTPSEAAPTSGPAGGTASRGSAVKAVDQEGFDHFLAVRISQIRQHLASLDVQEVRISVTFADGTVQHKNLVTSIEPAGKVLRLSDEWSEL